MSVPDEVLWEIEDQLGVEIRGLPMAYEGRADCTSMLCRRFMGAGEPGCAGWHCGVCDQPSSQYGHAECQE